ncbi:MAG: thiamine phosphate synthase [Hyphomonadaceae bacterium]|nr:thiamine phosphate synthase [Clostridia bacterium]
MKEHKQAMLLYLVTDRAWLGEQALSQQVEQAIQGGVTCVQLREKNMADADFLNLAKEIKLITDRYKIPFIINDNVDVAIAVNADGVHVGQSDMRASNVRARIGDKIVGVSAQTVEQAVYAEQCGASYIGVGAVFSTTTKLDANTLSLETLSHICKAVSIPVVAIGGINAQNIAQLKGSGIDGVAVVSAILAQKDILEATKGMRILAEGVIA